MSSFTWEQLSGTTLPDGFVLKRVIQETAQFALFSAHSSSSSLQPEALVEVVSSPQEDPQEVVNRFLEAGYLRHPHIAGISAAGVLKERNLVYAVAEPVEHTLTHFIAQRPLPQDDAMELVDHVAAALSYLHSENLVFCNLRPESVWHTAAGWKLGDFSQLRVIGSGNSRDLRATLARRPDLPPEVYEGVVSPAWDVWSLGVLLRRVLAPQPAATALTAPRGRQLRHTELPAPFDSITRDCLDPNPSTRVTLDEVRSRLRQAASAARPVPSHSVRPSGQRAGVAAGVAGFFRGLAARRPGAKALYAVMAAVLFLAALIFANALFRHPAPEPPALAQDSPPAAPSEADRSVQPSAPESVVAASPLPDGVKALLDKWVSSTRAHDVRGNLDCYTLVVDNYYGKQKLSRNELRREKQRQFDTIGTVRRYGVDRVQFHPLGPGQAEVFFDKQWSFGDRHPFSGAEREQLTLRKLGQQWKIAGERELKVYWVRHGRQS